MPKSKTPSSRSTKNRSVVPIKSTIESIKGYPSKLIIFKVPASNFYWTRYFDGKTYKRSTKTENKAEAIRFAKQFYDEINYNKQNGISNTPNKTSFITCANGVIEEDRLKAERDELSKSYVLTQQKIINKHIKTFFKKFEIKDIEYAHLDEFKTYLYDQKLAPSSIKIHFVCLNKIFNYAQRNKYAHSTPVFPKIKNEDNARGYFTLPEYKLLRRTARKLIGAIFEIKQKTDEGETTKKLRNVVINKEILYLIPFMIFTFIRPTDLKNIKHKHVIFKRDEKLNYEYLFLPIPPSKKHDKPLISMPRAAYYYKKLLELRGLNNKKSYGEEYLFEPEQKNRNYAYSKISRQFEALIKTTDLKYSDTGDTRTLYSLRHSALMYRLRYGQEISPVKLANNARTSVEMLTRFYLPQLQNLDIARDLHARKTKIIKQNEQAIFMSYPSIILNKNVDSNKLVLKDGKLKLKK